MSGHRWLASFALFALLAAPVAAQLDGRRGRILPERTDAGVWDGTWYYVSRDGKFAIWIKTERGKPKVKLRFLSTGAPEGFETDWNGKVEYVVKNGKGHFDLKTKKADADRIEGTWEWILDFGKSQRVEVGSFGMYRAGDGRKLVIDFQNMSRKLVGGTDEQLFESQPVWAFRKASKRLLLWDELPF